MNQPLIALTLFAQQDDNYHSEWAQRTCCVLNDPIDLMVNGSAECTLALPRQHAPDVALAQRILATFGVNSAKMSKT